MKCTPCLFRARMWSERSFGSETRFTAKKLDPKSGHFDNISRKEYRTVTDNNIPDMHEHMWGHTENLLVASRFVNVDKNFKHFQMALLSAHADKCPVSFHLHNSYTIHEFLHSTENICIESLIH